MQDPGVRNAATEVFGALVSVLGEKAFNERLFSMDKVFTCR